MRMMLHRGRSTALSGSGGESKDWDFQPEEETEPKSGAPGSKFV